jgi:hypothetical protein
MTQHKAQVTASWDRRDTRYVGKSYSGRKDKIIGRLRVSARLNARTAAKARLAKIRLEDIDAKGSG